MTMQPNRSRSEGIRRLAGCPRLRTAAAVRGFGGAVRCGDAIRRMDLRSGCQTLVLVDVAGHGAERSFLSAVLAETIETALLARRSPAAGLLAGDAFLRECGDETALAVAFAAVVNPATGAIRYASAGHETAFVLTPDGRPIELAPTASMLGVPMPFGACDAVRRLHPGDALVAATDGVSDSRPAGTTDFFGLARGALSVFGALRAGRDPALALLDDALAHAQGLVRDDSAAIVAYIMGE